MGEKNSPRIVLLDLETLPDLDGALENWPGLGNFPGLTFKATVNSICVFGYKIFGEKKAKSKCVWDYPGWKKSVNDDYELCKFAYDLLKDADAIVTQNGKRFDWPFLQTRLAIHKLPILPKIQHVDTKVVAKANLFMFSNSLKHLAKKLTNVEKMDHGEGWDLWIKTYRRDPKAMALMDRYCKQDVEALEEVFKTLRPLITTLPNYNMFRRDAAECCPNCGGFNIHKNGTRSTKNKIYTRLLCMDCGTSSRTNEKFKYARSE